MQNMHKSNSSKVLMKNCIFDNLRQFKQPLRECLLSVLCVRIEGLIIFLDIVFI